MPFDATSGAREPPATSLKPSQSRATRRNGGKSRQQEGQRVVCAMIRVSQTVLGADRALWATALFGAGYDLVRNLRGAFAATQQCKPEHAEGERADRLPFLLRTGANDIGVGLRKAEPYAAPRPWAAMANAGVTIRYSRSWTTRRRRRPNGTRPVANESQGP